MELRTDTHGLLEHALELYGDRELDQWEDFEVQSIYGGVYAHVSRAPIRFGAGPVAGHVVMKFWCGHEIHLHNGDEPVSFCFICHPPDPRR